MFVGMEGLKRGLDMDDVKNNIRSGAGTGYSVVGAIREVTGKKNKYTIVEEKNGWGRLKSGAGWIRQSSGDVSGWVKVPTRRCDTAWQKERKGTGAEEYPSIRM